MHCAHRLHADLYAKCLHVNPAHCLYMSVCLSLHRRVGVPHVLFKVLPWTSSLPNNIFPGPCFHTVSWAITVIAVIIGIILTLVPLCSRRGLTLRAIYADWLDRPGIPEVWTILLSFWNFSHIEFYLSIYRYSYLCSYLTNYLIYLFIYLFLYTVAAAWLTVTFQGQHTFTFTSDCCNINSIIFPLQSTHLAFLP